MSSNKQMSRIVGQCSQTDFNSIEHLSLTLEKPELLDTSTLTRRQKFAFHFLSMAQRKNIPWSLLRAVIQLVLFWGDDDNVSAIEIKFIPDPTKSKEVAEFKRRWPA